jgi:lipopolysaccharide biosynthesis glycosyltransferase
MLKIFTKPKKSLNISKPIDKFQGFLLLIILGAFYLLSEQYEYTRALDFASNHLMARIDSLERKDQVIFNITESILKEDISKNHLLEKLCNALIEEETDLSRIAEGYNCLAKLEYTKNDSFSAYRAIKNISYALEANYKEEYLRNLLYFITNSNKTDKNVEELIASENRDVKSKALYRMSLVYLLGRTSSKEEINYQLEKSIFIKAKILKDLNPPVTNKINILFSLNNSLKYINYAKNLIASLLLNADLNTYYNFYILMDKDEPISQENKNKLQNLTYISPYNIEFKFLPTEILKQHKVFSNVKNRILFGRFMVEDLFPELNSIITLDVDLIALRDLSDLKNQKNEDQFILAGMSEGFKIEDKTLCNFPYDYINSGVTVQNLKKMREMNNTKIIIEKYLEIQNNGSAKCRHFPEQDVLNILYKNNMKFISKRWNYIPLHNFSNKFMPFIIHFAGVKNWKYNNLTHHLQQLNEKYSQLP